MDKAKLVYTTEKKLAAHNIKVFDENVGREARREMSNTISQMHQTKKRGCIIGKGFRDMEKKYQEIVRIVNILEPRPIAHYDIYAKFYHNAAKDKYKDKYLQNLLQTIKYASLQVIRSKDKLWGIDPKYTSGRLELIATIKQNYSNRWRMSRANKIGVKETTEAMKKVPRKAKPAVKGESQVVNNQKIINISNISGPIDIPIVFSITIKVNVEYNK